MNKKIQLSILSIFIAAALIGSVATYGDNMAFAGGDNHHGDKHKKKSNEAIQGYSSIFRNCQSSCGSGNDTTASCNNVALSLNLNDGNNALGQE